jgi:UPF0755 protein
MKKRIGLIILIIVLAISALLAIISGVFYSKINMLAFNIEKPGYIYIDANKDYDDVLAQLDTVGHIEDIDLFEMLAKRRKYPQHIKSGRYEITPQMSYVDVVQLLWSGEQKPVKLTFNNVRLASDFTHRIGSQLAVSADTLAALLRDTAVVAALGFDSATILTMFIPNTYEIFWNTSSMKFLERMKKEYDHFWTPKRRAKADSIALTPIEVSILASIVEEETNKLSEYPIVAGLYWNRLQKEIPLQADPTVKFAVGNVTLRRILLSHLAVESPYNTYLHTGLPPGPIRVPSIQGIDAVLNLTRHDYLYMCAKEDFSGTHNFAVTLVEHTRNAKKYQATLNQNKIMK